VDGQRSRWGRKRGVSKVGLQLRRHRRILGGHVVQHFQIAQAPLQILVDLQGAGGGLEGGDALLRLLGVVPEVRRGLLLVQFLAFNAFAADVKESPAGSAGG